MKCLIVVAHPDDEVIWMGGLILRRPRWDWRIVSLCRANDTDRAPRFCRAVAEMGARAFISNLDDSPISAPLSTDLREIKDRVRPVAPRESDLIFTHGEKGEYTRHKRHEQAHRAVREMVDSGSLTGKLLFFAYDDQGGQRRPQPSSDADILINLSDHEYDRKRRIVREIYGFGPGSMEFDASGPVEAFRVHRKNLDVGLLQAMLRRTD